MARLLGTPRYTYGLGNFMGMRLALSCVKKCIWRNAAGDNLRSGWSANVVIIQATCFSGSWARMVERMSAMRGEAQVRRGRLEVMTSDMMTGARGCALDPILERERQTRCHVLEMHPTDNCFGRQASGQAKGKCQRLAMNRKRLNCDNLGTQRAMGGQVVLSMNSHCRMCFRAVRLTLQHGAASNRTCTEYLPIGMYIVDWSDCRHRSSAANSIQTASNRTIQVNRR
jgi:hypothetical protein